MVNQIRLEAVFRDVSCPARFVSVFIAAERFTLRFLSQREVFVVVSVLYERRRYLHPRCVCTGIPVHGGPTVPTIVHNHDANRIHRH